MKTSMETVMTESLVTGGAVTGSAAGALLVLTALVCAHLAFTWFRAYKRGSSARRQRDELRRDVPAPAAAEPVSVIVPAWNDARVIARTLSALAEETARYPGASEVWVVAGGQDGSFGTAETFVARLARADGWRVLAQRPDGKNAALNRALQRAKTDIFVFLDADTVVLPGWLEALTRPLRRREAAATAGCFSAYARSPVAALFELDQLLTQTIGRSGVLFGGGSVALRRETLEAIGGRLPEEVVVGVDWDLSERVRAAGLIRAFVPEAGVKTELPSSWREYWRAEVRWRRAYLSAERRHLKTDLDLKRLLGLVYVPAVQGLLLGGWVALPLGAALLGVGAGVGFALWLLAALWLTGRDAARCAEAYAFTRDPAWLRLAPTSVAAFCVSAAAAWRALATLRRLNRHFKGQRPQEVA